MAQKFLAKAATFEALKPLVEAQLKLAINTLNDLQARIPMLVEARYKPYRDKCECLRSELASFGNPPMHAALLGRPFSGCQRGCLLEATNGTWALPRTHFL